MDIQILIEKLGGDPLGELVECRSCRAKVRRTADDPPPIPFRPWHLRGSRAVAAYLASLGEETHEWLLALFLNEDAELLAVNTLARGSAGEAPIDVRGIVRCALALDATGVVLAHNHPSGCALPSPDDHRATRRVAAALESIDVALVDHFIAARTLYSFRDHGLL